MFRGERGIAVFDLDGTLVDSVRDIHLAANQVRVSCDIAPLSLDEIGLLIGHPAARLFSDAPGDVAQLVAEFRTALAEVSGTFTRTMPGVVELLDLLEARRWTLAVATNKPTELAKVVLDRVGLLERFDSVTGADGLAAKPDPAVIVAALGGKAWPSAVMLGDTTMDVIAGRGAGVQTVAVASGSHSRELLEQQAPDWVVDSLVEIVWRLS